MGQRVEYITSTDTASMCSIGAHLWVCGVTNPQRERLRSFVKKMSSKIDRTKKTSLNAEKKGCEKDKVDKFIKDFNVIMQQNFLSSDDSQEFSTISPAFKQVVFYKLMQDALAKFIKQPDPSKPSEKWHYTSGVYWYCKYDKLPVDELLSKILGAPNSEFDSLLPVLEATLISGKSGYIMVITMDGKSKKQQECIPDIDVATLRSSIHTDPLASSRSLPVSDSHAEEDGSLLTASTRLSPSAPSLSSVDSRSLVPPSARMRSSITRLPSISSPHRLSPNPETKEEKVEDGRKKRRVNVGDSLLIGDSHSSPSGSSASFSSSLGEPWLLPPTPPLTPLFAPSGVLNYPLATPMMAPPPLLTESELGLPMGPSTPVFPSTPFVMADDSSFSGSANSSSSSSSSSSSGSSSSTSPPSSSGPAKYITSKNVTHISTILPCLLMMGITVEERRTLQDFSEKLYRVRIANKKSYSSSDLYEFVQSRHEAMEKNKNLEKFSTISPDFKHVIFYRVMQNAFTNILKNINRGSGRTQPALPTCIAAFQWSCTAGIYWCCDRPTQQIKLLVPAIYERLNLSLPDKVLSLLPKEVEVTTILAKMAPVILISKNGNETRTNKFIPDIAATFSPRTETEPSIGVDPSSFSGGDFLSGPLPIESSWLPSASLPLPSVPVPTSIPPTASSPAALATTQTISPSAHAMSISPVPTSRSPGEALVLSSAQRLNVVRKEYIISQNVTHMCSIGSNLWVMGITDTNEQNKLRKFVERMNGQIKSLEKILASSKSVDRFITACSSKINENKRKYLAISPDFQLVVFNKLMQKVLSIFFGKINIMNIITLGPPEVNKWYWTGGLLWTCDVPTQSVESLLSGICKILKSSVPTAIPLLSEVTSTPITSKNDYIILINMDGTTRRLKRSIPNVDALSSLADVDPSVSSRASPSLRDSVTEEDGLREATDRSQVPSAPSSVPLFSGPMSPSTFPPSLLSFPDPLTPMMLPPTPLFFDAINDGDSSPSSSASSSTMSVASLSSHPPSGASGVAASSPSSASVSSMVSSSAPTPLTVPVSAGVATSSSSASVSSMLLSAAPSLPRVSVSTSIATSSSLDAGHASSSAQSESKRPVNEDKLSFLDTQKLVLVRKLQEILLSDKSPIEKDQEFSINYAMLHALQQMSNPYATSFPASSTHHSLFAPSVNPKVGDARYGAGVRM